MTDDIDQDIEARAAAIGLCTACGRNVLRDGADDACSEPLGCGALNGTADPALRQLVVGGEMWIVYTYADPPGHIEQVAADAGYWVQWSERAQLGSGLWVAPVLPHEYLEARLRTACVAAEHIDAKNKGRVS